MSCSAPWPGRRGKPGDHEQRDLRRRGLRLLRDHRRAAPARVEGFDGASGVHTHMTNTRITDRRGPRVPLPGAAAASSPCAAARAARGAGAAATAWCALRVPGSRHRCRSSRERRTTASPSALGGWRARAQPGVKPRGAPADGGEDAAGPGAAHWMLAAGDRLRDGDPGRRRLRPAPDSVEQRRDAA